MKKIFKKFAKQLGSREAPFTPGSFQEALDKHEKQLKIATKAGDRAGVGRNRGIAYYFHSDFPKAIKCYQMSLSIAREAGDWSTEEDVYFNLGIAYHSHSDFPNAIECYGKSLNIAREAGDRFGVSRAIHYLVICYSALGEFSQAAEYREEYLKIVNGVGGHTEEAEEERTCKIHGNFYRHFCEFRKQLAYLLVHH